MHDRALVSGLLWTLVRQDLRGRFAGSAIGFFWALIHPLVLLLLYLYVFDFVLRVRFSGGAGPEDYALFMFSGMIPWLAFQEALSRSIPSMPQMAHLIKNVRFPKHTLPMAYTLTSAVQGAVGLVLLAAALAVMGRFPGWALLWLPAILGVQVLLTVGLAYLLATLHVYVRDTAPLAMLALFLWMFLSPIFYRADTVADNVPALYPVLVQGNPWYYLLTCYRRVLLAGRAPDAGELAVAAAFAVGAWLAGRRVFARRQLEFGDLV